MFMTINVALVDLISNILEASFLALGGKSINMRQLEIKTYAY